MNNTELHPQLKGVQRNAFIVGVVGLVVGVAGFFVSPEQFFRSYLLGYVYWLSLPLGMMGLLMIHHLVGGQWAFTIRRFCESGAMTLPYMALLFIPILLGMGYLYSWTDPEVVAKSHLLQHKEPWLNVPFFIGRTILYFAIWTGLAFLLNKWSLEQDKTADPKIKDRLKNLSSIGIILFVLASTFAAFDWMMSTYPKWYSSMYGVIYMGGQVLFGVAASIILSSYMSKRDETFGKQATIYIFNDLSNFLLAFVAFWAYVSFSQYLILWSANLPETVTWYITRGKNGWQYMAFFLLAFGFFIPFLILLSRRNKRNIGLMVGLSWFIILIRFVDLFWILIPTFEPQLTLHWLNIALPLGIGGIWVGLYIQQLKGKPLLPLNDPRFQQKEHHTHESDKAVSVSTP